MHLPWPGAVTGASLALGFSLLVTHALVRVPLAVLMVFGVVAGMSPARTVAAARRSALAGG